MDGWHSVGLGGTGKQRTGQHWEATIGQNKHGPSKLQGFLFRSDSIWYIISNSQVIAQYFLHFLRDLRFLHILHFLVSFLK